MSSSFWTILLAVLSYGLLHSLLASLKAKQLVRDIFGPKVEHWYRLAFNVIAIITFFPILALTVLLADQQIYRIPYPWVVLTVAMQLAALMALYIGVRQTGIGSFLGLNLLMQTQEPSPPVLVTGGMYRFVRHPLYTSGLVLIWLLPVMTWNILALNLGLTLYILIGATFEERKLLHEFGASYAEYRQRTPMLIPGIHLPHNPPRS